MSTICKNYRLIDYKLRSAKIFFILQIFFHILDQLGLNFDAINLKFVQIVGNVFVYNLKKFKINSLQTEISKNFLYSAKILPHFGSVRP